MTVEGVAHAAPILLIRASILVSYQRKQPMTRYDVICPSAPWENTTTDQDRAWHLCLDLSEEYGYAQVRCNGVIIGEYTEGR